MREMQFHIYDDYGDGTYRWIVRESADCDGCVDLVYEHDGQPDQRREMLCLSGDTADEIAASILELLAFFRARSEEGK